LVENYEVRESLKKCESVRVEFAPGGEKKRVYPIFEWANKQHISFTIELDQRLIASFPNNANRSEHTR
jgi:hypothetical protein